MMNKDDRIEALKEANAYLLEEIAKISAESVRWELALVKLQCEMEVLKESQQQGD